MIRSSEVEESGRVNVVNGCKTVQVSRLTGEMSVTLWCKIDASDLDTDPVALATVVNDAVFTFGTACEAFWAESTICSSCLWTVRGQIDTGQQCSTSLVAEPTSTPTNTPTNTPTPTPTQTPTATT